MNLTDAEKARILDWLFTPVQHRDDRPPQLDRTINRNNLQALMVFRAWDSSDVIIKAIQQEMAR